MQELLQTREGLHLYNAGLPYFPRNFTRDSLIAAYLLHDPKMLSDQLTFCARHQGRRRSARDGEEPGKIFHEFPGVPIRGKLTTYNACDTTALFLWGHQQYLEMTGDRLLLERDRAHVVAAAEYIISHLQDDLFVEDPAFAGAKRFALRVTYWKDSELPERLGGEPQYPITYTLAHVQNLAGLRSAGKILGDRSAIAQAERMAYRLQRLWDKEIGSFYIALDRSGPIRGVSSDALQLLFYLDPGDLFPEQVHSVAAAAGVLTTPIGYRTLEPRLATPDLEAYHSRTVWPFEQALIYEAARRFNLPEVAAVSARITAAFEKDNRLNQEVYEISRDGIERGGCSVQLWTAAARQYFNKLVSFSKPVGAFA